MNEKGSTQGKAHENTSTTACVRFNDIVDSCGGVRSMALRKLPLNDETSEDRQKCLTQLKSKADETADGSMLYYDVHQHKEELKSSRKRCFTATAKQDMRKDEHDCMTQDMDDDHMAHHDADAEDGASSNYTGVDSKRNDLELVCG